jgi:hypothetical protein
MARVAELASRAAAADDICVFIDERGFPLRITAYPSARFGVLEDDVSTRRSAGFLYTGGRLASYYSKADRPIQNRLSICVLILGRGLPNNRSSASW